MVIGKDIAEIKSINQLLRMKLIIPSYQRPYKWTQKNVADLLEDIAQAIERGGSLDGFRYRVGTVILHWNEGEQVYEVVDGQQRIITLLLIRRYLAQDKQFIPMNLANRVTQSHLIANYAFIQDWFTLKHSEGSAVFQAFSDILEVVVITVEDTAEAFQLFDSQNSRGRELDPHDLLKAYHLREMNGRIFEMRQAATKWEAVSPARIKELFGDYLFPILRWSDRDRSVPFTAQRIDRFKGIPDFSQYAYAARTRKAMPSFQITEPFIAGEDFFSMVDHYLSLLDYLRDALATEPRLGPINAILDNRGMMGSIGSQYARTLFECALLCYYDRFRNLDEKAVKKLFSWAFMLRVDMNRLGFSSINQYAVGEPNSAYTNTYPMFFLIRRARLHTEISNLRIRVKRDPDVARNSRWDKLYCALKELNGGGNL